MSNKLNRASAVAVAAMVVTIAVSADGSGAAAQATMAAAINQEPVTQMVSQPVVQPLPAEASATDQLQNTVAIEQPKAQSLGQLVAAQPQPGELSRELNCLAGAIYFEAKSESLEGQLAVGRVVVERSKSGRFPNSYCGVVFQRSQFSFVRGNAMPAIPKASRQWKNAVAIAQIAHAGSWDSPVEGALFFHAARVSPNWRGAARIARVGNHIFYR
ncbi:MAG TPA: cell wall hydrolase [Novosphingobium sp.]|nr:cell wall hydrolase [Novosphingobium sp.]